MNNNIKDLPDLPGVYLFKKDGQLLYVGKAKSLKKRVASYFHKQLQDWKIDTLIREYTTLEHIVTKNEIEAQLLEAELINHYKPKYNVLLRSGQPFLYILFSAEKLPHIELVRNKKKKGIYYGPFIQKYKARSAYNYLIETFRLFLCHKKIEGGCLYYHMGKCAGMCRSDFDKDEYLFRFNLAEQLLKGRYNESLRSLEQQINVATAALKFEKARLLYGYLQNLETIFQTIKTKFSTEKYATETFLATAPLTPKKTSNPVIGIKIQELLGLEKSPSTIDCFDVSHLQGSFIVGSCIRFTDGVPDKNQFRRFKIRTLTQQNDYAALHEIVTRRYKDPSNLPDLILIDGGKGQLSAVKDSVAHTPIVALAKREERLFTAQHPEGIILDQQSEVGHLFMALRDYAHHFALSYHQKRRSKSKLDGN